MKFRGDETCLKCPLFHDDYYPDIPPESECRRACWRDGAGLEWESNSPAFTPLRGARLVSAFAEGTGVRLFFETEDGRIFRLKVKACCCYTYEVKERE